MDRFNLWEETFKDVTEEDTYEGYEVFAVEQQGVESWAGAAIHVYDDDPNSLLNLSDFVSGSYNFAVKIPEGSTHSFYIFLQDDLGEITQSRILFEPENDPPGVLRDGLWHKVSVPVKHLLKSGLNLSRIKHPFGLFSNEQLSGQMYYFDDIYFSCKESHIRKFAENVDVNWNNPENWTPQGVPSSDNIASVANSFQVEVQDNVSVFDVLLLPGSQLTVHHGGVLNVNSHLFLESTNLGSGSLIDFGTISYGEGAVFRKYLDNTVAYGWTIASPILDAKSDLFSASE